MARNIAVILLILSLFSGLKAVFSQESSSSEEVKVIARSWERTKERIFAVGNVEVRYKDIRLFADRVEINPDTKDAYAEGNVVIHTPDEVMSADKVFFNLDSSKGELKKVFGMIQPSIYYEAESIDKKNENLYSFQKAWITSCTQPTPRWNFSCSRANLKKDDYMEMWNAVFSIKKFPIFYLPYLRYPLNKERATGFLMPQVGYSGAKGFIFGESFYWAIARNMDATFNVDYYSVRGFGRGLEYRYLFSEGTGGNLNAYYFIFKKDPLGQTPANAYLIRFNHNQALPAGFSLAADIDYQSSFEFLREFDNNFKRAVISNRSSQVYLTRAWANFNLSVRASRFETYFAQINNSVISYYLPQISLSSFKIKLFSPLYFSLSSSFNRWEYGWKTDYDAKTQRSSQNLGFNPSLTLPFTSIPWLTLNSTVATNFTYYWQSFAPNSGRVMDEPFLTKNYSLNFELVGPVFFRLFRGADSTPKLKHIIEPSVIYLYESPIASPERLITAYGFYRYHQLTYSLTNRFLIKQDEMPKEILTLGLSETFYLAPEDSPLKYYRFNGKIPKFSDISGYVRFYPATNYSVDFSTYFDPYHKTFSSISLGANLGAPTDSLFLRVNWYKSITPWYQQYLWNRHQIDCFTGVKIPALSIEAQAEVDFNIQERKMLYSAFSFVYDYQCLEFKVDFRIFYFREKPETQFRISFGLGNIGKTTDFLGGIGF